jgi:hypothetical protein
MGRPPGSRNKKTLIREQRIREAAKLARGPEEGAILLDCLDVMEAGMRYFFGRFQTEKAEKKPDWDTADSALLHAVAIAKDITPYRHPRLTTMKVSHDPNADPPLDDLTREELRQQIDRHLEELGLFLTTERPANTNRGNGSVS